jgi:hypothetical protein
VDNARFVLRSGLEAASIHRFSPQSGGDGNTHGNTRRSDAGWIAGVVSQLDRQKHSGHAS